MKIQLSYAVLWFAVLLLFLGLMVYSFHERRTATASATAANTAGGLSAASVACGLPTPICMAMDLPASQSKEPKE